MSKRYAIGIDIGGTNLKAGLISEHGEVIRKIKEPVSKEILSFILKIVESLFSDEVEGIGLGIAGLVDRKGGKILISPNLPAVEGINFVDKVMERFRVPVLIENDATAAAIGEKWVGRGKEFSNFVLFTLGTGIGGGAIYEKKTLNISAEFGHMTVNADGEKCLCGNSGCLESYASARAILSKVISALEKGRESLLIKYSKGSFYKLTAEDIYRAALDGDSLARETLREGGRYLGIGIANIINLMSPEAVILTGGLTGAWSIFIEEAIKEASKRAFRELFDKVKILPSLLGNDAGIVGAAAVVFGR